MTDRVLKKSIFKSPPQGDNKGIMKPHHPTPKTLAFTFLFAALTALPCSFSWASPCSKYEGGNIPKPGTPEKEIVHDFLKCIIDQRHDTSLLSFLCEDDGWTKNLPEFEEKRLGICHAFSNHGCEGDEDQPAGFKYDPKSPKQTTSSRWFLASCSCLSSLGTPVDSRHAPKPKESQDPLSDVLGELRHCAVRLIEDQNLKPCLNSNAPQGTLTDLASEMNEVQSQIPDDGFVVFNLENEIQDKTRKAINVENAEKTKNYRSKEFTNELFKKPGERTYILVRDKKRDLKCKFLILAADDHGNPKARCSPVDNGPQQDLPSQFKYHFVKSAMKADSTADSSNGKPSQNKKRVAFGDNPVSEVRRPKDSYYAKGKKNADFDKGDKNQVEVKRKNEQDLEKKEKNRVAFSNDHFYNGKASHEQNRPDEKKSSEGYRKVGADDPVFNILTSHVIGDPNNDKLYKARDAVIIQIKKGKDHYTCKTFTKGSRIAESYSCTKLDGTVVNIDGDFQYKLENSRPIPSKVLDLAKRAKELPSTERNEKRKTFEAIEKDIKNHEEEIQELKRTGLNERNVQRLKNEYSEKTKQADQAKRIIFDKQQLSAKNIEEEIKKAQSGDHTQLAAELTKEIDRLRGIKKDQDSYKPKIEELEKKLNGVKSGNVDFHLKELQEKLNLCRQLKETLENHQIEQFTGLPVDLRACLPPDERGLVPSLNTSLINLSKVKDELSAAEKGDNSQRIDELRKKLKDPKKQAPKIESKAADLDTLKTWGKNGTECLRRRHSKSGCLSECDFL